MSEFEQNSDRSHIHGEDEYRVALERLERKEHPFRPLKVDKATGEVLEEIVGHSVWNEEGGKHPYAHIYYTVRRARGNGRWTSYEFVGVFDKPVFNPHILTKLTNSKFPYGIVESVLQSADQSREVMEHYREFLSKPCLCFTVAGRCGAGKTYGAVWLATEMVRRRKADKVGFLKASDLDGYLRSGNSDNLPDVPSRDVDFLILDDVCSEIVTSVIRDQATRLLDYRINRRLWTVITTNMEFKAIEESYGERFSSRLVRDGSRVAMLDGPQTWAGGELPIKDAVEVGQPDGFELDLN